jgi:hypothetical protein
MGAPEGSAVGSPGGKVFTLPCGACKGSGEVSGYQCYRCSDGTVQVELTDQMVQAGAETSSTGRQKDVHYLMRVQAILAAALGSAGGED